MKTQATIAAFALLGTLSIQPALADHNHHVLKGVAQAQQSQIRKGVRNGDLTRKEARLLRKEQRRIAALRDDFREDGWLSKRERKILKKRYRKAERHIQRLRHNDNYRHHRYVDRPHRWHERDRYEIQRPRFGIGYWDDDWAFVYWD